MPDHPRVAVIVLNWNGGAITLECLGSLARISYPNHQVLLVDNASSDGSTDSVRSRFPEVAVLPMTRNLRFAGGNNEGIRYAAEEWRPDYFLLLNNDTIVDSGFLEPLVNRAESDNAVGLVAPKIYYHSSPRTLWYAGGRIRFLTGLIDHRGIRETDNGQFDDAQETDYATGCCMLISHHAIDQIGLLDPGYSMYGEDADLSLRARRAGYKVFYEPRSRIWHRVSASAGGNLSFFKLRMKFVSQFRFFLRYARWYHWLLLPWTAPITYASMLLRLMISDSPRRAG